VLTPLSSEDATSELVREWLSSYISRPHQELGRRGAVCPYVGQAIATDNVELIAYRFGELQDLEQMKLAIGAGTERFHELARERRNASELFSLVMTFPDLKEENRHLVDEGHLACKTEAVSEGLMLGQFHPSCEAPAAHNPDFAVNRAPVPLMVIRVMSTHDALFLRSEPVWMEHYQARMGRRGNGERAEGSAPYVNYASLAALHEMQAPESETPLELSFVLVTQVKELLFRMLYVELDTARSHLREGDVTAVCQALARANRVQRVLFSSWEILSGMSPTDFLGFRDFLGEASGRQSFMYRALEFIMGNKDEASLDNLRRHGPLHQILEQEVGAPTLYDEAIKYLHSHVRPVGEDLRERDFADPHVASDEVEAAWLEIYREPDRFPEGYALAEALTELAFQFSQWRATHLLVVERMIGSKPGTGGTDGVPWLRRINDHRFFPELWSVRTRI
jgi:tryptophan 2,3-dioxygenase